MMVTLIIIGQLVLGVVIDHFGWLGVTDTSSIHFQDDRCPCSIGWWISDRKGMKGMYLSSNLCIINLYVFVECHYVQMLQFCQLIYK